MRRWPRPARPTKRGVLANCADIAAATYSEALAGARLLQQAVARLIAEPSEASLTAARQAWIAARPAYQQSEVFRFGNPVLDTWAA